MNILSFGGRPDGSDTTVAVRRALATARDGNARRLVFPIGEYHFWPDRAEERYLFVSNNDESLKRLIFVLDGLYDFEVDGQGSQFIFHGLLSPFYVFGAAQIRLTNFSIDWARPFHSEAQVLSVDKNEVELYIPEQFPYQIEHDRLIFTGEAGATYGIGNALEFDSERRETAFRVPDNYAIRHWHRAVPGGPRLLRFEADWAKVPTPGNVLVFMSGGRLCPAIIISDSHDVELDGVTLHHAGGMGVIAQRSRDLALRGVRVTPREGSGRLVSLTADATHFVCCEGQITIQDCLFENQLDDPVNIHGIYQQITQVVAPRELEVRLVHGQQLGVDVVQQGDTLDFVDNQTLKVYHEGELGSVERLNRSYFRLHFRDALPAGIEAGHVVLNRRGNPDVTITGCTSRGNRARGFLLSTGGTVRIEDNYFHTPGAAILIAGDANHWFESGPVKDVLIRGNTFDNCNYGLWGRGTIDINPEIAAPRRVDTVYHDHICIEENLFRAFDHRLLRAHSVQYLVFRNNRLQPTYDYCAPDEPVDMLATEGCPDAWLEAPTVDEDALDSVAVQAPVLLAHA